MSGILEEKPEEFCIYAGYLSYVLYEVFPLVEKRLQDEGMEALYHDMEMPLVFTLYSMEQAGIQVEAE